MFESESRTYKIFISYTDSNEEEYSIFIEKISSAHDFEYENTGIIGNINENVLNEQIDSAEVVIILSGLYNKFKDVIKKQLDIANNLGKPIIVIRPYGMENVPPELEELAEDVVGWNAPCIVDSIEESYPD